MLKIGLWIGRQLYNLGLLPYDKERYIRLPLGIWWGAQYKLEYLETTVGWHYWWLLMCWDNLNGWGMRYQHQRQGKLLWGTVYGEY